MSLNKKSGNLLWQIWLLILLISVTWQDFFLVNKLGEIARNPIFLFLPFFVLTEFLNFRRFKTKQFVKINNLFFYFIFGTLLISALYLAFWLITGKSMTVLGENVIIKSIKILTYYIVLWLFFRHAYFTLNRIGDPAKIGKVFFLVCILQLGILIVELFTIPFALPFFHSSPEPYYRIRLLTSESSFTGGVIVMLTTSAITFTSFLKSKAKRKNRYFLIGILFLAYVAATTSKMFMVTALACTLILILNSFKLNLKYIFIAILFGIIGLLLILPRLQAAFINDLNNFTSTVTRTSSYLNGYFIAFHHPFGTGGLYFYYFLEYVDESVRFVTGLLGGGNTTEILQWGIKDDKNIAPGAEFSQWLSILGIPGAFLFISIYYSLLKYSKAYLFIFWGVIYFTITSFFSEIIMSKPNVFLFWAVVLYFYNYKTKAVEYGK